jgi:hypothetical protein
MQPLPDPTPKFSMGQNVKLVNPHEESILLKHSQEGQGLRGTPKKMAVDFAISRLCKPGPKTGLILRVIMACEGVLYAVQFNGYVLTVPEYRLVLV